MAGHRDLAASGEFDADVEARQFLVFVHPLLAYRIIVGLASTRYRRRCEPQNRLCTTICRSVHSTRLSGKRRIRSWWLPSAAPSAAGIRDRGSRDRGAIAL